MATHARARIATLLGTSHEIGDSHWQPTLARELRHSFVHILYNLPFWQPTLARELRPENATLKCGLITCWQPTLARELRQIT